MTAPKETQPSGAARAESVVDGGADSSDAGRSRSSIVVTTVLALLLAMWLLVFLSGKGVRQGPRDTGMGGDFATFYTASSMVAHHADPYRQDALYRTEARLWRSQGLPKPKREAYIRAGNPPLLYWALGPLTRLGYVSATWLWLALMSIASIGGFVALLAALGWTVRVLPLLLFLAMPQTTLAVYYGNVDALVFGGVCVALLLLWRYPALVGACLALAWLKPQYALPIAVLVVVFLARDVLRTVVGFAVATIVGLVATVLTAGAGTLGGWVSSLGGISGHTGKQPDVASLSGLYVYSTSPGVQRALMLLTLAVAVIITAVWWWLTRDEPRGGLLRSGWLWVLWLLATPLAHFHYQIILAPVVVALLGRDGALVGRKGPAAVLFLLLLSIFLAPLDRGHGDWQSLALLPVLGVCLWAAWKCGADVGTGREQRVASRGTV